MTCIWVAGRASLTLCVLLVVSGFLAGLPRQSLDAAVVLGGILLTASGYVKATLAVKRRGVELNEALRDTILFPPLELRRFYERQVRKINVLFDLRETAIREHTLFEATQVIGACLTALDDDLFDHRPLPWRKLCKLEALARKKIAEARAVTAQI